MKQIIFYLITVLTFSTIACVNPIHSDVFLTTLSPNNTYKVEFIGNKYAPKVPAVDHEARFNLFKNEQSFVKNAYVDSYDWFDSDFAGMYPEHKWVSDSVLRVGYKLAKSEESLDSLSISNNTNKTVKYLKITIRDMLFVFEMSPKSKMKLQVPRQDWLSWVWSEGEFADGQRLKGNGANFFHRNEINEPLRYCLSIGESTIKVESPNMDGYLNGTSENPDVRKSTDCDL